MAITYNLGFNPFWTVFDLYGRPAGGAKMYTKHALNPTVDFPVFIDPAGTEAWTNPILFAENGQQGPFYFQFDDGNPSDTYFIEIFDAQGNLIWQIDDYSPITGSGGSVVTTATSITNYLTNSVFWRNIGTISNPPSGTVLCPGNHAALSMPDIQYVRTGGGPSDTITFMPFSPPGDTSLSPDVTPEYFLRYSSNGIAGETVKSIQFPLISHINNLNQTVMTYSFWARGNSGTQQLSALIYQYSGTGGSPTATVPTVINTHTLTGNWAKYTLSFTMPSASAVATIGTNGDDGLYFQIGFPLSQACNIDFTKPELYLGNVQPDTTFDTYDEIDAIVNAPRTGDLRTSINSFQPLGWVPMNDGTIGSATSGATTRANKDTFFLYSLIWNQTNTSSATQLYAPIFPQNGYSPTTRGTSASDDFAANKPLSLTRALGRALAGAVPTNDTRTFTFSTSGGYSTLTLSGASPSIVNFNTGTPIYFTTTGSLPTGISANVTYYSAILSATTIGIATTPANAIAAAISPSGTNLLTISGGTGTQSVNVQDYPIGTFFGNETFTIAANNLPAHVHTTAGGNNFVVGSGGAFGGGAGTLGTSANTGVQTPPTTNSPITQYQPTAFYNVFAKL